MLGELRLQRCGEKDASRRDRQPPAVHTTYFNCSCSTYKTTKSSKKCDDTMLAIDEAIDGVMGCSQRIEDSDTLKRFLEIHSPLQC